MRRVAPVIVILALSLCAGAAGLAQQDPKPAKAAKPAAKPASFEEVLRPFIGKKCSPRWDHPADTVLLDFIEATPSHTLDMVGKDFVRLSRGDWKLYYQFTSIKGVSTR